jgi:hypothetical protein
MAVASRQLVTRPPRTWPSALRLLAVTLAALLLAWTAYVAVSLSLGHISEVRFSGIEVDSGQLDVRPGTPGAAAVGYVTAHTSQFGWGEATGSLTIRLDLLGRNLGTSCFEVLAADRLYVMTVAAVGAGYRVMAVAENVRPDAWRRLLGPDVLVCGS